MEYCTQPETRDDNRPDAQWWADLLAVLKCGWNVTLWANVNGLHCVQTPFCASNPAAGYRIWSLCDNGGELNIEPINCHEELRPVPYTVWSELVDAGTMAYRVACVLYGREIDYDLRCADLVTLAGATS